MSGPAPIISNGGPAEQTGPPGPIAQARKRVGDLVAPNALLEAEAEIKEAEANATTLAQGQIEQLRNRANDAGSSAFASLGAVRDDAKALAAEVRAGRVSVEDAVSRLARMDEAIDKARQQSADFDALHERADSIAADPVAYGDAMYRRFPSTAPRFTF